MTLRRAWWLFVHPTSACNEWECINANLTVAVCSVIVAIALMVATLLIRIWLMLT